MTMPALGAEGLPNIGDVFEGKYRIEKLVGKGGMGAVFAAHHTMLDQRVAVKFLLGDMLTNPEAARRFENEAKAAAQIKGQHICQVFDFGRSQAGLAFMVMEFLEGRDLSELLEQRGALPVEEAVDYVLQALEAIAQAHKRGMVHRDLKPANLYLARLEDGKQIVKVLDFGISKASNPFSQTGNHSLTSTKSMLGSPLYMSPEQLRSAKNVDARADIWSLGVILYELLTGRVPFNGESLGELFVSILEQQTPRVSQIRPDVPQVLDEAIARCLQRPLEARWPNVAELAHALAPCAPARAVISVERIFSTLGVQQTAPFPVAHMPQEGSYSGYQQRPQVPPVHVSTGSGSGAYSQQMQQMPPQMSQGMFAQPVPSHTQDTFGRTGSGVHDASSTPVNRAPLFVLLGFGALLLIGGVGVGLYALTHRGHKIEETQTAQTGAPTNPPPPTATAPPTATTTATISTAGTTPAPTDSVTVRPVPTGKATGTKTNPTSTGTGKVASSATATATATATTAPTPTSTGTGKFDPFNTGRKN